MDTLKILRDHLVTLLDGRQAHLEFDTVVDALPFELQGRQPEGAPHSAWQLLEHMRIAQWDILEFSRNPKHVSPSWPEGYWPQEAAPRDENAWGKSVADFRANLQELKRLVSDPKADLFAPFPHGDGQTLLREALLVADHNAYHLGQLVLVRRLVRAWSEG